MHVDLWGWFNEERRRAIMGGNSLKYQMTQHYYNGWDAMRAERGDEAVSHFMMGLDIAKKLNEPCWDLFFEYWCSEAYVFVVNDYQKALEYIVQTSARAHKPQYIQCPVRARVYYTLMHIYYETDVLGYEEKIREIIKYMEDDIPLDDDTAYRLQYKKASLAYDLEDYATAKQELAHYMSLVVNNAHRQTSGFSLQSLLDYTAGDLQSALENSIQTEKNARIAKLERSVINAMLRQATLHHRMGNIDEADELYYRGLAYQKQFGVNSMPYHYNAVCEYLEIAVDAEQALKLREESLETIPKFGSPDYTTSAHLSYCQLLGRMGRDTTHALKQAREAAKLLIKPARYLSKLQDVENGNYYQYEWQKNDGS